jgi:hypothetical protein
LELVSWLWPAVVLLCILSTHVNVLMGPQTYDMSYTTHIMLIHVEPLSPWPVGKRAKLVVDGDDEVAIDCLSLNFFPT